MSNNTSNILRQNTYIEFPRAKEKVQKEKNIGYWQTIDCEFERFLNDFNLNTAVKIDNAEDLELINLE